MLLLCSYGKAQLYDSNHATPIFYGNDDAMDLSSSFTTNSKDLNELSLLDNSNVSTDHIEGDEDGTCFNTNLTLVFLFFEFNGNIESCLNYLSNHLNQLASNLPDTILSGISILNTPSDSVMDDSDSVMDGKSDFPGIQLRF